MAYVVNKYYNTNKYMKYTTFIIFVLSSITGGLFGQNAPFVLGKTETLSSGILSEGRTLNIYLPDNYTKQDSLSYPVLYLLDGSAHEDFIHIVGLVQFMCMYELLPPAIVVGIANVDRKRDFTFPTSIEADKKKFPTTGGSAKFIDFIEKELQPYIEKNYRTNSSKIIIGQSLGALVATEILFKKPGLFNTYIIISPSLWWDKESLLAMQPEIIQPGYPNQTSVFVGVGKEGKVMERDAKKLAKILKNSQNERLSTQFEFFPKENHATVLHQAVYTAFRKIKWGK